MNPSLYWIWTAVDCAITESKTANRSWFNFRVQAPISSYLTFTIKNLNNFGKLYREGMKPAAKIGDGPWHRLKASVNWIVAYDGTLEITFTQFFSTTDDHQYAFCFPWSYTEN